MACGAPILPIQWSASGRRSPDFRPRSASQRHWFADPKYAGTTLSSAGGSNRTRKLSKN